MIGASGCCSFSAPHYRGPASDHFDGRRFHNQAPVREVGLSDLLYWLTHRHRGPWRDLPEAPPGPPPPRSAPEGAMRITFINHSTTLLQQDGVNLLTDPIYSERATPVSFVGPGRARPPGIRFEDLPPIDVVLISHDHYDHLDLPTLKRLHREHRPRFIVPLGARALLEGAGIRGATELDWWQDVAISPKVQVVAVPAQHFSGRGLGDRAANLWAGYVVRGPAGASYFAGDTGFGPHFAQIAQRLGQVRLALLPIGAFQPRWFMAPVHLSPDEAVVAAEVLGAGTCVAIHFGTFRLADDGQDEPVARLTRALESSDSPVRFWALGFGEGRDVPPP